MTSLRIAWTELRRLLAGRMPKLVVFALVMVPTLYAGFYLYANHDPYANLDNVPAALVNADAGATQTDGKRLEAGDQVADQLLDRQDFGWKEVNEQEAEKGVEEGRYDFALVIPQDFSAALNSTADMDPEKAKLQIVTNDANSYLSTTIANTLTTKVRDAIASQVSEEASTTFLLGISDLRGGLLQGADGADQLHSGLVDAGKGAKQLQNGAGKLSEGAGELSDGAGQLSDGAGELSSGLGTMEQQTASLPSQTRKLADGARQVAAGDRTIADYGDAANQAAKDLKADFRQHRRDLNQALKDAGLDSDQRLAVIEIYDEVGQPINDVAAKANEVDRKLNRLARGAEQVADGNEKLAASVPQLVSGIKQAHDGADQLQSGANELQGGANRLQDGADQLQSGAGELHTGIGKLTKGSKDLRHGLRQGAKQVPNPDPETRKNVASTIGDPVSVKESSDAEAGSYGAGLAPFFLALGSWIGCYVLFLLVRPLSTRALASNQSPLRIAIGGWLTPALIGVVQMVVVLIVVGFAVKIEPSNWIGTLGFLILTSATFVAIVHMLNALWGTPGEFLGLVLMVLQLVTSGGTFPWQTIPEPLHVVHHALPMSYAVDGLRQLMYGGLSSRVALDCLVLAAYLVGAIVITSFAARRQRVWTPSRVRPEIVL